jgi:uncharacterized membrane protein
MNRPLVNRKTIGRIVLGVTLLITGSGHLSWAREEFQAQVPGWVPMDPDRVVMLSGVVEVVLGLALIFLYIQRTQVGWATALFFLFVFPGNVAQFVNGTDAFGLNSDLARGIRLLFQPVLIGWALWTTDAWPRRRIRSIE